MNDSEPPIAHSPQTSTDPREQIWGDAKRAIERRLTRLQRFPGLWQPYRHKPGEWYE